MSSFYSDASLIVIPSGYKASKVYSAVPTDGTGDLTFTRSNDTATRVNSAGLIEKVRTNLVLQSNTFSNAAWLKSSSTSITASGVTDPNGGTTAVTIFFPNSVSEIYQSLGSLTGSYTDSIYVKGTAGETIALWGFPSYQLFTLTGEWQRISKSNTLSGSTAYVALGRSGTAATATSVSIAFAQFESGDIATDYIATTTAAVSVGPVANVPRLDYLNSTCPKLLLEPQRTNLVTNSENISGSNWTNVDSTDSINVTATLDPSGYYGADKLQETTANSVHVIAFQTSLMSSANTYTFSSFLKAAERNWVAVYIYNGTSSFSAYFNLATGVKGSVTSSATSAIESYGNGWYRCSVTLAVAGSASANGGVITATADGTISYAGTAGSGIYVWGAQLEAGAYASSYIPTLAASVTRGVDACVKTGISSLLGGTQGTWFLEMKYQPLSSSSSPTMFVTGASTIGFASSITNGLRLRINAVNDIITSVNVTLRHKIAISFDATGVVCFFNGNQITLPNGASEVVSGLDSFTLEAGTRHNNIDIYQMLYLPTRLDNATLASLTTL